MPHSPGLPKTCFVLPDGHGLGGVTTWSIRVAERLARYGHPCALLEHAHSDRTWQERVPSGVPWTKIHAVHPSAAHRVDLNDYAPHYLAQLPATLIPNYSEGCYAACAEIARTHAASMRVLAFAHGDQDYYYNLLQRYEPIITTFVAVSAEIGQQLTQRLPHRSEDIVVRPYGVPVPSTLLRTWTSATDPLRLVYAGRLVEEQKRVLDLVRLARKLGERDVDFVLDIVGNGADEGVLRDAIGTLPPFVRARVMLVGRMRADAMAAIWSRADVAILVSKFEGTSIAMLEAMAHGCVPVVTRVSGTAAAIDEGRSGYTVPVGDIPAMAAIVERLAEDRAQVAQCGRLAHATMQEKFGLDAYLPWLQETAKVAWTKPARTCTSELSQLEEAPQPQPTQRPYVRYSLKRFLGKVRQRALGWME